MPDIFSNTNDGKVESGNLSSHAAARGASTGTAAASDTSTVGIKYFKTSGRGAATVNIARSFFFFDTSGVTGTVSSATLSITVGNNIGSVDIIPIKSDLKASVENQRSLNQSQNLRRVKVRIRRNNKLRR